MGIKNLTSIIKHNAPQGIAKVHLSEYRGRVIAIDTSIYMYKYMYNGNYLDGFVKQILRLFRNNITPLYIFDGKPPDEKKEILKDRKEKRDILTAKKEELETLLSNIENTDVGDTDMGTDPLSLLNTVVEEPLDSGMNKDQLTQELQKITKKIIKITSEDVNKIKKLMTLFGVPYIVSNGEAEDLCSQLCKEGRVYGCLSEDTDILANGGCRFIRDFNSNNDYVTEYTLDVILTHLTLTYNQFIDMCILCGCDYTGKIGGIGPVNAYKYIQLYETIEAIIENIKGGTLKKHNVPDKFDYVKARELFTMVNTTTYDESVFKLSAINSSELIDFVDINCTLSTIHTKVIKKM